MSEPRDAGPPPRAPGSTAPASAEPFRELVECCPDFITLHDAEGRLLYGNPAVVRIMGYPMEERVGTRPAERREEAGPVMTPEFAAMFQARLEQVARTGEPAAGEAEWSVLHGRGPVHHHIRFIPVPGADGRPRAVAAYGRDISDVKATERERARALEQLHQRDEELRQAQKMEAFGRLAGGVAHDFNNLLTVIRGNVSLLEDGAAGHEREASLAQIAEAADRAARLTRQLLLFSRRQPAQGRDLDLNDVAGDMARMLRRLIGEHIQLETGLAPEGAPVHADLSMMEQVLVNLVVNARDAMPGGGRVRLETACVEGSAGGVRPGRWVRLTVSDTGSGIAAEHLPHLFEPFFSTKEVGKGTGLGLATVYGIAELHGGWVEVESREGEGATFRLFLPRRAGTPVPRGPSQEAGSPGGTEGILLVEDDPPVRSLARRALERLGYRVLEAATGAQALEVWAAHHGEIALLLTDLVMPGGLNGRQLAERLRAERPGLKVLYCTGYADDALGGALEAGEAPSVLEKPYQPSELARRVRASLDE